MSINNATPLNGSGLPECTIDDLVSYAPSRACIYLPCKTMWPNASVDDRIPPQPLLDAYGNPVKNSKGKVTMIPASKWLAQHRSVAALTWDPGKPEFIHDSVVLDGGYIPKAGATTLNFYRPPPKLVLGNPAQATRWIEHWRAIYPGGVDHIIAWLAFRVQHPGIKINHALVLGGYPKIGKDTLLEAAVQILGEWNFQNIMLSHLIGRNNNFLKSLIVRLNEVRDANDHSTVNRYQLNDHMKNMLAAPPNTLRINEKYINEYYILNRTGMIITTNYRDALILPPDDRRHYVEFSERRGEEFPKEYWRAFWAWYEAGGFAHVAALLFQYDLSDFDPKADPPKTDAFWHMVTANRGNAYEELADAIEALGNPAALTLNILAGKAPSIEWLHDDTKRKFAGHRLADCQYVRVDNRDAKDKLWKLSGRRQVIYARSELTPGQREDAAIALCAEFTAKGGAPT